MPGRAVFPSLAGFVAHRRRSWGAARELGYQECRKKQVVCQAGGVGLRLRSRVGHTVPQNEEGRMLG